MAARWGAGEDTLTIGGMELFTADSRRQCHTLNEDEACTDLSDISLTSLDTEGLLSTLQGYVDHSIISIINAPEPHLENKDHYDEENELSLLTALTEILDNADDENLSPFDTIPDSELLVSPKERDSSSKFVSLSRTPPECDISIDDPHRYGKIDGLSAGQNWELFPENIVSTPKRHNRHRGARGSLLRRVRTPTHQRSDGEEEEIHSPEKKIEAFVQEFTIDSAAKDNEFEQEMYLNQKTPCIINTENFALKDLVKYMHPYCLPSITVCVDSQDGEIDDEMLNNAVFLEIVSEEGESIKLPILMELENSLENTALGTIEKLDSESNRLSCGQSIEHSVPVQEIPNDLHISQTTYTNLESLEKNEQGDKDMSANKESTQVLEALHQTELLENELNVPKLQANSSTKSEMGISVLTVNKEDCLEDAQNLKQTEPLLLENDSELGSYSMDESLAQVAPKDIRRSKRRKSRKRHAKKSKITKEKPQETVVQKTLPAAVSTQQATSRSNNPSLQESDFLVKQIDQVKRDSQMELRSSKMIRAKGRTRVSLDSLHLAEKKILHENLKSEKPHTVEKDSVKLVVDTATVQALVNSDIKDQLCGKDECLSESTDGETGLGDQNTQSCNMSSQENIITAVELKSPGPEDQNIVKSRDDEVCDGAQLVKEAKPKPLSLSEYRMRMQQRKPNTEDRENENVSGSKWPSIPELPTELAEIPCLIVPVKDIPTKITKNTIPKEEKSCPIKKDEKPLTVDGLSNFDHVQTEMTLPPVIVQEPMPPKQHFDAQCSFVSMDRTTLTMAPQLKAPPIFYPSAWPCVPPNPYPNFPSGPALPNFSSGVPHVPMHLMPLEPTPLITWQVPPYPPPPISIGQVPPPNLSCWGHGVSQQNYWPPPPVQPRVHERIIPLQSTPENIDDGVSHRSLTTPYINVPPNRNIPQILYIAPLETQSTLSPHNQIQKVPVQKTENVRLVLKDATKLDKLNPIEQKLSLGKSALNDLRNKPIKLESKVNASVNKPEITLQVKTEKTEPRLPQDLKKTSLPLSDLKSANAVVFRIMEMLKRMQKKDFPGKPETSQSAVSPSTAALEIPKAPQSNVEPPHREKNVLACEDSAVSTPTELVKDPVVSVLEKTQILGLDVLKQVTVSKPSVRKSPKIVAVEDAIAPVISNQNTNTSEESLQFSLNQPDLNKSQVEDSICEKGIEAPDLTSLLEEFEKTEAKDDDQHTQSPVLKLAVGNSRLEKPVEKKIHDRQMAPELVNTAGLTPPATPPHQLWKPVTAVSLIGKPKLLNTTVQERSCSSPVKTAKLIDAKPLPQNKLRNRNSLQPSNMMTAVHVASGDHDYCISSGSRPETCPVVTQPNSETKTSAHFSYCEEGSRWNVKHHQHITIKPIVPFNKRSQDKLCQRLPTSLEFLKVTNQSIQCGTVKSKPPCEGILKDQLDHRTNELVMTAEAIQPDSVLMSPDSSPCQSEAGESRTGVRRERASVSRRSLRCYRKYRSSPSPQRNNWNDRKSNSSRSSSSESGNGSTSSSSSSRSRSRSPPTKKRRTYRSRSQRSRSSVSSCSSSSRSRSSSSYSSRSCSTSSSHSRSRSRSPYRRRFRSRSRRCESRESYNKQKIFHKERAIEERRVVYIGKISSQMTRSELRQRFSVFGDIEECTIHFRDHGDNYGFVTYRYTCEAFTAIENGHKLRLPDELPFDLCFGGRRQFCRKNYADLDSNRDDFDPAPVRSKFEDLDFDTLLKQAQKSHRR